MSDNTIYVGTAVVPLFNNVTAKLGSPIYTLLTFQLNSINIDWGATGAPPEASNNGTLAIQFPQGYAVGLQVSYIMTGHWYTDPAQNSWVDSIIVGPQVGNAPGKAIAQTFLNDGNDWNYTMSNPFVVTTAPNLNGIPLDVFYRFSSSSLFNYTVENFTWNMLLTITATRSCGIDNITTPICVHVCQSSPNSCIAQYTEYCLSPGNESRIGMDPCKGFLANYINKNGSLPVIDTAVQNYCSAKYGGFNDLFGNDPVAPSGLTPEQLNDLPICACNIRARGQNDPNADILYQNYFKSLTQQFPGFANVPGIVDKCTLPVCVSATFHPLPIPVGGCKVPECLTFVEVNNDGTINGNVQIDVSQKCGDIVNPEQQTIDNIILFIVILFVVIILIIVLYSYFTNNKKPLNANRKASVTTIS